MPGKNYAIYHHTGAQQCKKKIVAVINQDRMIDGNLRRETKN